MIQQLPVVLVFLAFAAAPRGWGPRFQHVDEPLTGRLLDGENGHMGFVSVADVPYAGLVSVACETSLGLPQSLRLHAAGLASDYSTAANDRR